MLHYTIHSRRNTQTGQFNMQKRSDSIDCNGSKFDDCQTTPLKSRTRSADRYTKEKSLKTHNDGCTRSRIMTDCTTYVQLLSPCSSGEGRKVEKFFSRTPTPSIPPPSHATDHRSCNSQHCGLCPSILGILGNSE